MGSKDNRTLKYCSSFEFSGLTGIIYGCADSKNVGLMNSWWKMSRMMKIVGILRIPRILLILSIYWLYYPPRQYTPPVQWRGGGSSNLKKPNTPMSKFACQAELQESSPPSLLSTRWKRDKTATSDETFLCPDPDSQFANHQLSVFNVTDLISWWVNFIALCIGVSSTGALAIIMWEERLVWLGANTARPPAVLTPT